MMQTAQSWNYLVDRCAEYLGYKGVMDFKGVTHSLCRDIESHDALFEYESDCYDCKYLKDEMDKVFAYVVKTYSGNFSHIVELYDKYNAALIDKGIIQDYAISNDLDFIDASSIDDLYANPTDPEKISLAEKINAYGDATGFFGVIPPFTKACIRLYDTFDVIYDIIKLDRAKQTMIMQITAYEDYSEYGCKSKIPYVSYKLGISGKNIRKNGDFTLDIIEPLSISDMYRTISPKQLKWNKTDRLAWSQVYLRLIRALEGEDNQMSVRCVEWLSNNLITAITGINYILSQNRAPTSTHAHTTGSITEVNAYNPEAQKERQVRILRTVGPIAIKSVTLPTLRDEERVMNYQVAAWSVRGHMRHYKNGKSVYIKPRVNRRRCMGDIANDVTPRPQALIV